VRQCARSGGEKESKEEVKKKAKGHEEDDGASWERYLHRCVSSRVAGSRWLPRLPIKGVFESMAACSS